MILIIPKCLLSSTGHSLQCLMFQWVSSHEHTCFKIIILTFEGIKKMSRNEWIRIDRGYMNRIKERQMVMREHAADAIGTSDIVNPAIAELYEAIMINHLPNRFPTMFRIEGTRLLNLVTGRSHSIKMQELSHAEMLQNLGESVEEDFYIMCPDEEGEIRLQGYIACFPGGFLSRAKVGMSMREIHQPVPGYAERIGKGADRHLQRLEPGNYIERMNVSSDAFKYLFLFFFSIMWKDDC